MAVVRVMYLLELRVCLLEKMLTDFIDGVDIFLSLLRDADPATLTKLQVGRPINPLKPSSSNYYTLPYRPNLPFLISDIRALWRSGLSARVPECQKLKTVG